MTVFFKKNIEFIFLAIICIPILFININHYHDWGDDFAFYIDQAKHIFSNEPFITNQVGTGFSLLLLPFYLIFGNSIPAFIFEISMALFFTAFVLYRFFKTQTSKFISILMVIFFVYHYQILRMKLEIMPVFPFMLVLYSCFLLYQKKGNTSFIILSIMTGFLISIASSGYSFFIAVAAFMSLDLLKNIFTKVPFKENLKKLGSFLVISIFTYLAIKLIVSKSISSNDIIAYQTGFDFKRIPENFSYYLKILPLFFEQEIWGWFNIIVKNIALIFLIAGIFNKWRKKFDVVDAFFILYIMILLSFNIQSAGLRYLIPILPLFLAYIVYGLQSVFSLLPINKNFIIASFLIVLIGSNYINLLNTITKNENTNYGPQSPTAVETFNYIKRNISTNAIIVYVKPKVLHLYSERNSIALSESQNISSIKTHLKKSNASYVLLCDDKSQGDVCDLELSKKVSNCIDFNLLWRNSSFLLFEMK
jgi:hypothetical protein